MVIDWENGKSFFIAPHLQYILTDIQSLRNQFEMVPFSHIYWELNSKADTLSKLALAIYPGVIEIEEHNNG